VSWTSFETVTSQVQGKNITAETTLLFPIIFWQKRINYTNSLWIKLTDAPNSSFIAITTVHVSGSLSAHHQELLAVHRLWYILCSCDDRVYQE